MTSAMESEVALLGAMILDPSQMDIVSDEVTAHDFADPDLGAFFDALVTLRQAGMPVNDVKLLVPELRRMGVPESVHGAAFILRLTMSGKAGHAKYYAHEVQRASRLRAFEALGRSLTSRAAEPQADPAELAAYLDAKLSGIGHEASTHCRRVGEVASELVADIKAPQACGRTVMTGLRSVDESVGGFAAGELIVLAARTSIGKTTLAMQIGMTVATRNGSVLFVSLEMRDRELVTRILCGSAEVNVSRVRTGQCDEHEIGQLEWAAANIDKHPLFVFDPPRATTGRIRGQAKRVRAEHGLGLLVVDHIGLVQPADSRRQRYEQVGAITADLKAMAKELSVPVLALAQLNREADSSPPRLAHLRESGSIEQDADIVWLLHRDDTRSEDATLIVAKHRHGETGKLPLRWVPRRLQFEPNDF